MMEQMHGMMRGGMMGGGNRYALLNFDADKDGTLSAEELRAGMLGDLKTYDTNGDGTPLDEFQAPCRPHPHRDGPRLPDAGRGRRRQGDRARSDHRGRCHAGTHGPWGRGRGLPGGPDGTDRPGPGIA